MSSPPLLTHKHTLVLSHATPSDLQTINDIWYTCFPQPFIRKLFPDTPAVQQWWRDANLSDMNNKPSSKYLLVRDHSSEGDGIAVGYAKWWVPVGNEVLEFKDRFPEWCEEQDMEALEMFFGTIGRERQALMGSAQYYYLDMLATIPSYRRKGVASLLVDWGVQQADRDGLGCFVDASDEGVPVYRKFGFVGQAPFEVEGAGFTCTSYVRPAKA